MTKRARFLALVMATSSLLVAVPGAQAQLRVGKNFQMNSDTSAFRGKDEVGLAVNPSNPNHVVAINAEYLNPRCEGTASFDGGSTWSPADTLAVPPAEAGGLPWAPACSLIGDHLADFQFQTVAFGSGQDVYTAYGTRRVNGQAQGVMLAKSTDGGRSWDTASVAMPVGLTEPPYYERPTVAVQRGGGPGGADRVYVAAHRVITQGSTLPRLEDAVVAVSDNSGASFSEPVVVDPPGETPAEVSQPAIDPTDGSVYVAWRTRGPRAAALPAGQPSPAVLKVARSDEQGREGSWSVREIATVSNLASTAGTDPPRPEASTGSTFPRIAVGPNGNVYIVYNQGEAPPGAPAGGFQGADHFIPPDSDVYFQRSTNKGVGWSTPMVINDTAPKPGTESPYAPPRAFTQTRHPELGVAPNGRIDIVWQDRRHWYRGCVHTHRPCAEARLGDTYLAQSDDGGASFGPNHRVSDRSHNNDVGYDYRFGTGWDFGPVVAPQGNDRLLIAWMDSRNGSFDNDNQDIYLAKATMNGGGSVPQENLQRTDPVGTSVRLSQHTYPGGGEGLLASTFATRNGTRVVIAPEGNVPAILAAGVLARANLSQVLLSPPGGLPASVAAEVRRMNPAGAYIVGGTSALGDQVANGLPNNAVRLAGADDAGTAQQVAEELDRRTDAEKAANAPAFNAVAIVNPDSPDAVAVAGLAAARRLPILFANRDSLPAATRDAISNLNIDKALVIGGSQVVSDAVLAELPGGERLGGADQYATSQAVVAESVKRGLPTNLMYVADGTRPIDGALLGSTVGRVNALMALSRPPLSSTAGATAAATGLSGVLDRLILLEPVAAGPGNPPPAESAAFPGCPTLTANVIRGTAAANSITGTTGADRIFAGPGKDVVDALAGNDCVDLGTGSDRGQGGLGNDLLVSGTGRDRVSGSSGNDRMRGNSGNDRLDGGRGNDRLLGDSGNDTLLGSFGNDRLLGMSGRDRITGSRGRDRISGGSSADRISGGSSADRIAGGSGGDRINGNSSGDRISGNSGNDRITSLDNSRDRVNCGTGRDRVLADRKDVVSRNCERVVRRRSESRRRRR